jgi:hypothetical protein
MWRYATSDRVLCIRLKARKSKRIEQLRETDSRAHNGYCKGNLKSPAGEVTGRVV